MSLLSEAMESCTMQDKTTVEDGYGGVITVYNDGANFDAACVLDNSMQARAAEQQGVKALYTVTTNKSINLQFHDIFRRNRHNNYNNRHHHCSGKNSWCKKIMNRIHFQNRHCINLLGNFH